MKALTVSGPVRPHISRELVGRLVQGVLGAIAAALVARGYLTPDDVEPLTGLAPEEIGAVVIPVWAVISAWVGHRERRRADLEARERRVLAREIAESAAQIRAGGGL